MRESRRKSILKEFEKKNEKKAFDDYEQRLFDFLVELGDLYDENFEHLRVLNINLARKGELLQDNEVIKNHRKMKRHQHFYARREKRLDRLGKCLREALCINLYDPNPEEKAND